MIVKNEFDTSPALLEAQYKSLNITINGLILRSQDLIDIQINYEDIIRGRLSFVDTLNISELAPLTYAFINIDLKDLNNNELKLNAIATDVRVGRLKDNQINIIIKFEDVTANILKNSYISKSFIKLSTLQIIQKMVEMIGIKSEFYHDIDDIKHDYFITPANISVFDFITKQIKINNIVMFSDRTGIVFISKPLLNFKFLPATIEHDFKLNRSNTIPHWNILEYDGNVNRTKYTQLATNCNLSNVDNKDLKYNPNIITIKDLYLDQEINGYMGMKEVKFYDLFNNIGRQEISHIEQNLTIGNEEDFRDIINNHQNVEIVVQGLNVLRMYSKIKLLLPRAIGIQTQESDETFSCTYVVKSVVDKVIGGNFYQFLSLSASDYSKGNDKI